MTGDDLIREYATEYTEKVFYFCLRRCGDAREAEDLAQTVSLRVLTALRRGNVPEHFPAWVWRIARSEFARWVADVKKAPYGDIDALDIAADGAIDDALLLDEDVKRLRRELAFVARDYREILVAYYIDEKRADDIARSLNLPKGTVLSKLHRIRKKLKEGMEMAREFGVLSYKPEDIGYSYSVAHPGLNGEPWNLTSSKLHKNLLLAAYRTPSTAEQLAVELGVALPYIEDELARLVSGTVMVQNGDKYETAFVIVDAETYKRTLDHAASIAGDFTKAVIAGIEYLVTELDKHGINWHGGYQAFEDMKWALLMMICDEAQGIVMQKRRSQYVKQLGEGKSMHNRTKRPYGGEWDVTGYQMLSDSTFYARSVGEHGQGISFESGEQYYYDQFKYHCKDNEIFRQTPNHLEAEQAKALVRIAQKRADEVAQKYLDELADSGHIRQNNGEWEPAMMTITNRSIFCLLPGEKQNEYLNRILQAAVDIADAHYGFCADAVIATVSDFMKNDAIQIDHAVANMCALRGFVLDEAMRTGYITYDESEPDSAKRRMLGAYLAMK